MGKSQREKGKRYERQWARFITDRGITSRRIAQHRGAHDSPDVVTEVGSKRLVGVAVKKPYQPWLIVFDAEQWAESAGKVPLNWEVKSDEQLSFGTKGERSIYAVVKKAMGDAENGES